jgi:hypothetical protein
VARWLCSHDLAPQYLLEDAEAVATINCVLDYRRKAKQQASLVREVKAVMTATKTA